MRFKLKYLNEKSFIFIIVLFFFTSLFIAFTWGLISGKNKTFPYSLALKVYGDQQFNIVGVGSDTINTNILGERLNKEGWKVNMIQNPDGFHFCVTAFQTSEIIMEFIQTVKKLIPEIPDTKTRSKCIYGTMQTIPDPDIIKDIIGEYLHIVNGF